MAVGKLRMKGDADDAPILPRKRRRRSRSPSDDARRPSRDLDDDESTRVPKPSGSGSRTAATADDDGLVLNWTTTSPRLAAKLLSLGTDSAFRQKLFDAMAEDEPLDSLEAEYGFTVPSRWRNGTGTTYAHAGMAKSGLEAMEEEEYAEYVRRNMWRRTHRQEVIAMEERDREAKRKERELKEARRKQREDERERKRRAEQREQKKAERERQGHREAYTAKWASLNASKAAAPNGAHLQFSDIPWPVYPPRDSPISADSLTSEAISRFLLDPVAGPSSAELDSAGVRDVLRAAIRSYHPDRFRRHADRLSDGRERALEWGLKVSQVLNTLVETYQRQRQGPNLPDSQR